MKKKIIISVITVLILGISAAAYVWFFVYNKKHKNIADSKPDFTTTAVDFINEFETSDTTANKKYNEKIIQFTGTVNSTIPGDSLSTVVFDEEKTMTISVEFLPEFNEMAKNLSKGSQVIVKALYVGYLAPDPLLAEFGEKGDIKLKKGSIVKE